MGTFSTAVECCTRKHRITIRVTQVGFSKEDWHNIQMLRLKIS